jgi:tyrosine-protein kinase Etk/Wzc
MSSPQLIPTERGFIDSIPRYLTILRAYKWLIIAVTVGVTLLTLGYCILSIRLPPGESPLPNIYRAQAVLLIQQQQSSDLTASIMTALGAQQATTGSTGFETSALVLRVLVSRSILDKMVSDFDLSNKWHITTSARGRTRDALHARIQSSYEASTGAITISFVDADPVFARDIVNHLVSLLGDWFSQNSGTAKIKQLQLLEQKVTEVKTTITGLESQLKQLQNRYGVLNAQDLSASQSSYLADLRSQLILKEIEIKNYSSFSLVDDARLQQLNDERQNILDLINQVQSAAPGVSTDSPTSPAGTNTVADVALQFTRLSNELDIQRRIYNLLSPQYEAAKLTKESEPVFQVLELAEVPDVKVGPARSRIVAGAFIGALFASVAASLLLNSLRGAWKRSRPTPS